MEENWHRQDVKGALRAEASKSGHCVVESVSAFMGGQGAKARSIGYCDDGTTPTLKAAPSGGNTVPDVCYALKGNFMDRDTRQNGCGWRDGEMYTLDTTDRHGVVYPETARTLAARHDSSPCVDRGQNVVCYDASGNGDGDTAPTLTGDHERRVTDYTAVCVGNGQLHQTDMGDKTGALNCMHDQQAVVYPGVGITSPANGNNHQPGDPAPSLTNDSRNYLVQEAKPPRKYIVRRLTPTECARLQGFPDEWCEGLGGSDSAQYKMWGNGIALPCAVDVLGRIARAVKEEST